MNTNKKVMVTALTISSLAVNVLAADNNFVGGTDNVVETGVKSAGVVGYQNTIKGNNAVALVKTMLPPVQTLLPAVMIAKRWAVIVSLTVHMQKQLSSIP